MARSSWHRNAALIAPLVLVNAAAVYGQAGWGYDHLGHNLPVAVLFAAAVESIGVYLAAEAHAALMAGDASIRLRLGSYAVGALVGCLNYAHFASAGYRPNPLALTFGLLSSISPWLWAIRSRSLNRDRLRELGQIDPRAVRFSLLRWALFPIRTSKAFRGAVWDGIVQPTEAVRAEDVRRAIRHVAKLRKDFGIYATAVPASQPVPVPGPLAIDVEPFMLAALTNPTPALPGWPIDEPVEQERRAVPAQPSPARRAPVPDRRILAALADPEAVPRRTDGTVAVRDVERRWGVRQARAVRLLREAGLYRESDAEPVPA